MKLQKILGGALLAGILSLSATAVYAADAISFGKPIDLSTNNEVTEYTEGMIIAVPVDIQSSTGKIDSFSIKATGAEGLTPGATTLQLSGTPLTNLKKHATKLVAKDSVLYVASNVKMDNGFEVSYPGTYDVAIAGNKISTGWMNAEHVDVNADEPELFLVYTVTTAPTGLNVDVASVVDGECSFSDTSSGQGKTNPTPANETTTNKCEGAFKIVVDPAVMGEKRIHALHLYVNGTKTEKDITEYVEGETTFEFPVRLTDNENNLTGVVPIVIKADIGGATGEPTSKDVTVASFNLDLSRTATDYTTQAEAQTATAE